MHKVIRWLLVLGLVGAAAGGFLWYRQQQQAEQPLEILRSAKLERGVLEITVSASGSVTVKEKTPVLIQTRGEIASINVGVGDRIVKGQPLASIGSTDLKRSLEQAEINLQLAELSLEEAQEPVDEEELALAELAVASAAQSLELARLGRQTAKVDANAKIVEAQRRREQAYIRLRDAEGGKKTEDAQIAYAEAEGEERAARLNAEATIEQAESQYQSAYTAYQRAVTNLETLQEGPDEDRIEQQKIQVAQARLRIDQVRRSLDESDILAPHDGIVAEVAIEEGTYQSIGQPAFTIVDDSGLYVDVTIDEIDISAIAEDQLVSVVLDAYPERSLTGIVTRIAPSPTEFSGLVAYNVRVEIQPDSEIRIFDDMTASVNIATEAIEDTLLLPAWAIRVDQDSAQVYTYVIENEIPVRRNIELGRRTEAYSEVTAGLSAGETVALVLEEREFTPPGGPPSGGSPFD